MHPIGSRPAGVDASGRVLLEKCLRKNWHSDGMLVTLDTKINRWYLHCFLKRPDLSTQSTYLQKKAQFHYVKIFSNGYIPLKKIYAPNGREPVISPPFTWEALGDIYTREILELRLWQSCDIENIMPYPSPEFRAYCRRRSNPAAKSF